ncbi:hypothetical protein [Streptomyces sp. NPDC000983]|uniref:hypothetical protein n=1 Tax=Streptomyces sp. NPDC000983 TaxID=3154373 RepID=UPI0033328622
MDIASDLALIDRLCARDLPEAHGGSLGADAVTDPPGYHRAVLGPSDWPSAEDCYAYEAALAERLTDRWGEPSRWGTTTLVERLARGEHIPEPWALLGALATELRTWPRPDDRRLTLTVVDADGDTPLQVLVVVTTTDPP